jgi:hypothetical protein
VLRAQGLHGGFRGAQAEWHGWAFVSVQCQTNFVNFIVAIYAE